MSEFKLDYLSFGTNYLTRYIESELVEVQSYNENRFYQNVAFCPSSIIQTSPRIKTLYSFSVRLNKECLNHTYKYNLPIDCKIQRIDFAIDVDSRPKANKYLISKEKPTIFKSETGITYYYGDRKKEIYERVYYLKERGFWRYELEFKPRADSKHSIFIKQAHKKIVKMWYEVNTLFTESGQYVRGNFDAISKKQKTEIDIHLDSRFVPVNYEYYSSLDRYCQMYMEKKIKNMLKLRNSRGLEWYKVLKLYNDLKVIDLWYGS